MTGIQCLDCNIELRIASFWSRFCRRHGKVMMKTGPSLNLVSSGWLVVGGVCMESSSRAGVFLVHLRTRGIPPNQEASEC